MCKGDLNGIWKGYYELGADYGKRLEGMKTRFKLFLKTNNGEFSGECIDETNNNDEVIRATVKGFYEGGMISFIKQSPVRLLIDDTGKRITDKNSNHPEIEYSGYYNDAMKMFAGNWELVTRIDILDIRGEKRIGEEYLSGTWQMTKEEI